MADWMDWTQVAGLKPIAWEVPTSIEITKVGVDTPGYLGHYYHAPQPFNIDVYKKEDETYGTSYVYYFSVTGDDGPEGGWKTTSDKNIEKRINNAANPSSRRCGGGDFCPVGFGEYLSWKGDGNHYTFTSCPNPLSPEQPGYIGEWEMLFHFEANPKSRVGLDWDRWEECKESFEERNKWKKVPASEAKPSDIKEGLEYQMDVTNFKPIEHDRNEWSWGASLKFDIVFVAIPDSVTSASITSSPGEAETKAVQVQLLSGDVADLNVPSPYSVTTAKQMLAVKLNIPAFMQSLVCEAGTTELSDEDTLSAGTLITLVVKEPPLVSVEELFDSIIYGAPEGCELRIFKYWYDVDTYYEDFPNDKEKLREWALSPAEGRLMKHVPLTRVCLLESFDVFVLFCMGNPGQYEDSFVEEVDALVSFFEEYCYSPSLLQVYAKPLTANEDVEFVLFVVGRLRSLPQTLMVQGISLQCAMKG